MYITSQTYPRLRAKSHLPWRDGHMESTHTRRRFFLGRSLRLEPLEDRSLLSISVAYVDNDLSDWMLIHDQNGNKIIEIGDTVAWNYGQSDQVLDLVYGESAFTTIQEAVDAANPGDTVRVQAGEYIEQVTINKSLDLIGAGVSDTIIKAPTSDRATVSWLTDRGTEVNDYVVAAYTATDTIDVRIEGFTIDANEQGKTTATRRLDGVFFGNVKDTDASSVAGLFSCCVTNFGSGTAGVMVEGNSVLHVEGSTIEEYTSFGIDADGNFSATDLNVTICDNVLVGNAAGYGVIVYGDAAATIQRNDISGSTGATSYGIMVSNTEKVVTIGGSTANGNTVNGNFIGIQLQVSNNAHIIGNTLLDNTDRGIQLCNSDNNDVFSNTIGSTVGTFMSGIGLSEGSTGNKIGGTSAAEGNTITLATSGSGLLYAICMQSGVGDNTIQYNNIQGGMRAVEVDGGNSGTTTIANNTIGNIVAPSFGGIMANSGNLIVTDNTLTNAVRPLEFYSEGILTVTGNHIYGSTFDAINIVRGAAGSSISNNVISGATFAVNSGIRVQNGSNGMTIDDNEIDHVLYFGIQVVGGTDFMIANNVISYIGSYVTEGCCGWGISLDAPRNGSGQYSAAGVSLSTISGNEVSFADDGITLYYSSRNQITQNSLHDLTYDGIWAQDASYNTISENTVARVSDGLGNGMGIAVYGTDLVGGVPDDGGSDHNTIIANTVMDCDYGLLALDLADYNAFTNNFVNHNSTAIGAWTYVSDRDPHGNTFHENDLSGNTKYFFASDDIDASRNWFGAGVQASAVAAASTGIAHVDFSPMLDNGDASETGGFQADYSSLTATALGAQLLDGRIEEAIDLVDDSGTVHVAAGTYVEQVTINKSLDLIGVGEGLAIIQAPASRDGKITIADSGIWDYIVAANATSGTIDVRVEGVTIDANGQNITGSDKFTGVLFNNVSGDTAGLFASTIYNFGEATQNFGVRIYGDSRLTVDDNTLYGYTRDGIVANGDEGGVTTGDPNVIISNNELIGVGDTVEVQNGIQVAYGATGSITGNTISNHAGSSQWWSTGILVSDDSENVIVRGNRLSENTVGVYIAFADNNNVFDNILTDNVQAGVMVSNRDSIETTTGNIINHNTITGGWAGIWSSYCAGNSYTNNIISKATGSAIYFWDTDNNTVSGNTISDMHDKYGTAWGIALDGGDTSGTLGSDENVLSNNTITDSDVAVWVGNNSDNATVTNNFITGNAIGVQVDKYNSGALPKGTVVHENDLSGNAVSLFSMGGEIDAALNWFGTTNIVTIVSKVFGLRYIDISPMLESGDVTTESDGFQADLSKLIVTDKGIQVGTAGRIEEAVNLVTEGGTVDVGAGDYVEDNLNIGKQVSVIGSNYRNAGDDYVTETTVTADVDTDAIVQVYNYTDHVNLSWLTFDRAGHTATAVVFNGEASTDFAESSVTDCMVTGTPALTTSSVDNWYSCTAALEVTSIAGSYNVTFARNIIEGVLNDGAWHGEGIMAYKSAGIVIEDNVIDGGTSSGQNGIGLIQAEGDVTGNIITNCDIGIAYYATGGTIADNDISDCGVGIDVVNIANSDTADIVLIYGNYIHDNGDTLYEYASGSGIRGDSTIALSDNRFENNTGVQFDGTVDTIDLIAEILANNTFDRAVTVSTAGAISVPAIYSSIQRGVDAAGDTVNVAAGTYTEQVTITKSLDLIGAGSDSTIIDGNDAGTVISIDLASSDLIVSISGLTITGGKSSNSGGGIYNVHGSLTVDSCTIAENEALNGGGIYNGGTLTLTNSTVSGNEALNGGGIDNEGTFTLTNSTIAENSATGDGGGIYNGGTASIHLSTIAYNSAATNGGGIYNAGTIALDNTIVADNTNTESTSPDIYGTVTANYCLILATAGLTLSDTSDHNLLNIDPVLGALGSYGGAMQTIPLLRGSPAVNAGNNDLIPAGVEIDERGFERIYHVKVDLGAYECRDKSVFGNAPRVTLVAPAYTNNTTPTVYVHAIGDIGSLPSGTTVYLDVDLNNDGDFLDSVDGFDEQAYCTGTLNGDGDATILVTPALAENTYQTKARVTDTLYNEGVSDVATMVVDVTAPTVTINRASTQAKSTTTSPIYFTVVFNKTVTGFSASDVVVGGTAPGTFKAVVTGSGPTYTVAVSGMTGSGTVTASIKAGAAQDLAGNLSKASTSTDNSINFISGPMITNVSASATTSSNKTTVTFNVADNKGVTSVKLTVDGKNVSISRKSGDKYSATYGYSGMLSAAKHTFVITTVSSRGTSVYAGSVTVAATTPVISNVSAKATTSDKTTTISCKVTDIDGIKTVKLSIDGGSAITLSKTSGSSTSANYSYKAILAAGTHTYTITATGSTGKAATPYTGSVTVNATIPIIKNVKATAKTAADNTTITWTVYDIDGIRSTTLKIDGKTITSGITHTGSGSTIIYTYTGKLSAGKHAYTIDAKDAAPTPATAKQFKSSLTVKATVPTISKVTVTATTAKTTITWTATDIDGISTVKMTIDGKAMTFSKSGDKYTYTGKLSVGKHTCVITAVSTQKLSTKVTANFTVSGSKSAPSGIFAAVRASTRAYADWLFDDDIAATSIVESAMRTDAVFASY